MTRRKRYTPCPIHLHVLTNIAVAGIVDDKQVIASCMLNEGCHLYAQLDAGVRNGGYGPFVGVVVVSLAKDLFKGKEIVLGGGILFPSQQ